MTMMITDHGGRAHKCIDPKFPSPPIKCGCNGSEVKIVIPPGGSGDWNAPVYMNKGYNMTYRDVLLAGIKVGGST